MVQLGFERHESRPRLLLGVGDDAFAPLYELCPNPRLQCGKHDCKSKDESNELVLAQLLIPGRG